METEYVRRADIINIFTIWMLDLTQQIEENIEFPHTRSDLKVCKTQLVDCIQAVRDIPAAEVRLVVRGRWKAHGDCGVTECSVCRWSIEECVDYNFCPNCGADMRETGNG